MTLFEQFVQFSKADLASAKEGEGSSSAKIAGSVGGGMKQNLISMIPFYGTHNSEKKLKGLRKSGVYKDDGTLDITKIRRYKIGDDWSDLKNEAKKTYGKGESKKLMKHLYKGGKHLTETDRDKLKELHI